MSLRAIAGMSLKDVDLARASDGRMTIAPKGSAAVAPKPSTAPDASQLVASPFQIDHRGEVIRELRADADVLDKQAAEITHRALALRLSADHLEEHPPE